MGTKLGLATGHDETPGVGTLGCLSTEWGTLGPGGERVYGSRTRARSNVERLKRARKERNRGRGRGSGEDRSSHEGGPRARVNERASERLERSSMCMCVCVWVGK